MKAGLYIIVLVLPFLVGAQYAISTEGEIIIKQCISENESIYDLELHPATRQGNIRLRWEGQDVFYNASILIKENYKLTGIAQFSHSMTGETKGNPWIFSYSMTNNTLADNEMVISCN